MLYDYMSTKKTVTKTDIIFSDQKIELRSVYSKSNIKYYIQPCRDKNGYFPECIKKPVTPDSEEMILSEREKNEFAERKVAFFPENKVFEVYHGKTYDLNDMWLKAEWEAIKNCPLIAKSRDAKDANGNLVIDGEKQNPNKITRSGVGELYVYRPGLETQKIVNKRQLIHKAETCIFDDEFGSEGRLNMARILGKDMRNQPDNSVTEYLLRVASNNPQKIIDLYSGEDISLRLMFLDAKDKHVIYIKNKLYLYGDNIVLGATDDSVIAWMKDPKNHRVLELIKKDTYPEFSSEE